MRIVIGSMQCEGNSLTPIHTKFEDLTMQWAKQCIRMYK